MSDGMIMIVSLLMLGWIPMLIFCLYYFEEIKALWHNPRDVLEAEWYMIIAVFMVLWMWMLLRWLGL